ncbi:MAG: Ig-like domain-containing protein [Bacteroidetes bacterium]|nr:Ig-like domain-containing protein [Bacteroidota bacterium]
MRKHYYFLVLFISVFTVQASTLSDCLPLNITGNFSICMTGPSHTPTTSQLIGSGGSGFPHPTTPWTSSNPSVATVDMNGLVTSVGFGSTTITFTDSAGTQVSQNVYVSTYPTISGVTSTCASATLQLNGSLFPHPTTPWQSSNTAVATVDNTGLVSGVSAGTCTITYMNIGGCTTTQTVTINPLLSPTVSCGTWANNAMTFNWNSVLGATNYSVMYNVNGGGYVFGASGNFLTYTVSNVQPTDQVVLFVVPSGAVGTCFSGAFSCQSTPPCPDAGVLSGNQNVCVGDTTTFTSSVSGGAWSSSNTAIASVNPTTGVITGNAAGVATMTYTILGTGGCSNATATRTVTVNQCSNLTLISDQSTLIQSLTLNAPISNIVFRIGNGVTNVSVTGLPSGVTGTLNQDTYTLAGTPAGCGVFNYTVTASGANGITSMSGVISVITTTSMFCDSANSFPNSLAIDWAPIQGATNYVYAYSINGGPTQTGSTLASNYQIPGVQLGQSVLFTLNNAIGVSCFLPVSVTCSLLADSDFDADAFSVYPNPVQDVLHINDLKFTSDISLFNAFGQEVYAVKAVSNSCNIPMSALADGIYLVKISAQEQTKTIKVIKN